MFSVSTHTHTLRVTVERMVRMVLAAVVGLCMPLFASSLHRARVLVADGLAPAAIARLNDGGVEVCEQHLSAEELDEGGLAEYDAVIVRSATTVTARSIETGAAGRLKIIGRAGVGVDNIDCDAARSSGLTVLNTPGASTTSVVELTLAHMLAAARGLHAADVGLKSGAWLKGRIKLGTAGGPRAGHELAGKRLGLLGFGRIAKGVARAASALGMEVRAYSRSADPEEAAELGVTLVASDADLFASCTHVAVLCALSDETRGLVDLKRMELMPQKGADGTPCGAHLFNLARGGIVVEADAATALQDGALSTYAADVFEQEPPPSTNPLLPLDDFHGTPHVGAATLEAQARVGMIIANSVLGALEGAPPPEGVVVRG